ncbi:hypothetical protein E1B28_001395 [Marasmius oreades]|uniref:DUF7702 domain-containing protein n=1 Tax=Marasmius oreades TaxID=181124 RepID=A0A9P7V3N8_9AGAR|nr:uncharacterized protein E1B28_001395 [Marasmius oreades]KAG7099562.1 hypothetical protein E1B28_001395 [Marasmius oreades]
MLPPLSIRGKIAAGEVAFWVPLTIMTLVLTVRYGFRKDAGWLFLFLFSLTRIAAGALMIAIDLVSSPAMKPDMFIAEITLFSAGLALLFLSAIGFLSLAGQHQYSEYRSMSRSFRGYAIVPIIALGLSIAGDLLGTHVNPEAHIGLILRRVAAGVYGGAYLLLVILAGKCWTYQYYIKRHRRRLLAGVTFGLLFLGTRVAYGILDAWSASDQFGASLSPNPALAQFNSINGNYITYLVMGLVMEFATATTLLLSSTVIMRRHY